MFKADFLQNRFFSLSVKPLNRLKTVAHPLSTGFLNLSIAALDFCFKLILIKPFLSLALRALGLRLKSKWLVFFTLLGLVVFSPLAFSHGHHNSDKQIEISLALFEKAIQLSPDLVPKNPAKHVPFYKVNGYKVYLTGPIWELVRMWMVIYLRDIELYCKCDIDIDLMIREAKKYIPKNPLLSTVSTMGKNITQDLALLAVYFTAKYGRIVASIKVSAEIAETLILMYFGRIAHFACNAITATLVFMARTVQKTYRFLSFGGEFSNSRLLFSARMAWVYRQINKSQKRVFFTINESLAYNREKLEQLSIKNPNRLLWIESLKAKTDPLIEKIKELKLELSTNLDLTQKQQNKIEKRIENLLNKIDQHSAVNRKDFFGKRFKRYLWLKSRKNKKTYLNSYDLKDNFKAFMKSDFWPLGAQYILESVTEQPKPSHLQSPDKDNLLYVDFDTLNQLEGLKSQNLDASDILNNLQNLNVVLPTTNTKEEINMSNYTDGVISGLIEEYLKKIYPENTDLKVEQKVAEAFLSDFHVIFDSRIVTRERFIKARIIEAFLSLFWADFLAKAKRKIFQNNQGMTLGQKTSLVWRLGQVENLSHQFSDFLAAVSVIKDKNKIHYYKYETIEKFLSFLLFYNNIILATKKDYTNFNEFSKHFDKLQQGLTLEFETFFSQLDEQKQNLKSLSLNKEKRTAISLIPFKKARPQCKKIIRKYQ